MAKKRPRKFTIGTSVFVRPIRGPHVDGTGRWYWQALTYAGDTATTVWSGWGTPDEVTKAIAGQIERNELGARREAPPSPPEALTTVRDLCEAWVAALELREESGDLTRHGRRSYTNAARRLSTTIGEVRVDRIDASSLDAYRDTRLRTCASSTVWQDLKALRTAWRWGHERGHLPERDLPRIAVKHRPVANRRTPSAIEVAKAVAKLQGWPRVCLLLLFATGARIGEIATLTWADVDLATGTATLCGKTGPRLVPLAPDTITALHAWGPGHPAARILRVTPKVVTGHFGSKHLSEACEAAGVPVFTPHGLRRAAVDQLQRAGVDVGTAAALLGHTPVVMLQYYRKATIDDKRAGIARARMGVLPDVPSVST